MSSNTLSMVVAAKWGTTGSIHIPIHIPMDNKVVCNRVGGDVNSDSPKNKLRCMVLIARFAKQHTTQPDGRARLGSRSGWAGESNSERPLETSATQNTKRLSCLTVHLTASPIIRILIFWLQNSFFDTISSTALPGCCVAEEPSSIGQNSHQPSVSAHVQNNERRFER